MRKTLFAAALLFSASLYAHAGPAAPALRALAPRALPVLRAPALSPRIAPQGLASLPRLAPASPVLALPARTLIPAIQTVRPAAQGPETAQARLQAASSALNTAGGREGGLRRALGSTFDAGDPGGNSSVPAGEDRLGALNSVLADLLSVFNEDPNTKAGVNFERLAVRNGRVAEILAGLSYSKSGPKDTVSLNARAGYMYPDGGRPSAGLAIEAGLDVLKHIPQAKLNRMGEEAAAELEEAAQKEREKYGDAAKASARVESKVLDAAGNLQSIVVKLSLEIDLSKLPEGMSPRDVPYTQADVHISLALHSISLRGDAQLNPLAKAFEEDEVGLKEWVENLLKRDPETLMTVIGLFTTLDTGAGHLVD